MKKFYNLIAIAFLSLAVACGGNSAANMDTDAQKMGELFCKSKTAVIEAMDSPNVKEAMKEAKAIQEEYASLEMKCKEQYAKDIKTFEGKVAEAIRNKCDK